MDQLHTGGKKAINKWVSLKSVSLFVFQYPITALRSVQNMSQYCKLKYEGFKEELHFNKVGWLTRDT